MGGRAFFLGLFLLGLAGCGGGGGGGGTTPPPPPVNRPPSITSPATASVVENSSGTIYTATATDPDSNPLTFSLSGGADQARFAISAAGALSFLTPPDFEAPSDADANNVYLVTLMVSDGTASATLALSITVTDSTTGAFRVTRVGTGFNQPVSLVVRPDNSLLVVERAGRIRILNPATGAITSSDFINLGSFTTTDGERGLLGITLSPDFATNLGFYMILTNPAGDIEIVKNSAIRGSPDHAGGSGVLMLRIPHPGFSNHNGGFIEVGPDGFLYVGIGDGGGGGDPNNNAQNRNSLLGKILRINPSGDAFPTDNNRNYTIPADNPFAGGGGAPEIWALGLRNPFRGGFDRVTGNLWIGDVGQDGREEINVLRPTDGGANLGWNFMEGTAPFAGVAPPGLVPPVAEYGHGSGPLQGNSITGGRVYRGPIESLWGQYIFADFISTNIWSFPAASATLGSTLQSGAFIRRNTEFTPNAGTIGSITCFGVDQAGNLYFADFDGDIFRIEAQ